MYYTGNELVDLQMELQENREEANPNNSNSNSNSYIARTARVQHQDKQIEQLLNQGYTVEDVIYSQLWPVLRYNAKPANLDGAINKLQTSWSLCSLEDNHLRVVTWEYLDKERRGTVSVFR